jgi:hypothetical protein
VSDCPSIDFHNFIAPLVMTGKSMKAFTKTQTCAWAMKLWINGQADEAKATVVNWMRERQKDAFS